MSLSSPGSAGLGREICAFANATGGTILLGVADNGEVLGVAQPQSPEIQSPVHRSFSRSTHRG